MKIPKTTTNKPYIDFRFNKKGKIKLSITSSWWGGKNAGFVGSGGFEGNTCLPKDLDVYIEAFKKRKIKLLEKEITALQNKLKQLKIKYE